LVVGAGVAALALVWSVMDLGAELAGTAASAWLREAAAAARPDRRAPAALSLAVRDAGLAVRLMPSSDRFQSVKSRCFLELARTPGSPAATLDEAERAARRAVALAPLRAGAAQVLAEVLTERAARGDSAAHAAADTAWRRFARLAPCNAIGLSRWTHAEIRLGRPRAALEPAQRAARAYPWYGPALLMLSGVQADAGDSSAARATLRRAVDAEWTGFEALRQRAVEALAQQR
jgi:tetratricopeptide (TPR) repeat protein